jgi:dTDP-4-amino-4,6-dideoxygalactose transaminase
VYAAYRSDQLSVAEAVWQRILTLPLYPHMGEANQDRVIEGVKLFVEGQRVDFAAPQHAVGG